ncbi:Helix-loop-helix DNA-Hypothetical protein domain [Nesidiocoris tenuis]|uniref:BHLH domain-containing protein n=1 Tax=Nesidiocoris tenuis TaxID=355587 RepID=A0ABN7AGK8_9HEMI|nr:Helix-loop-helix DNA-Hypothetical protein domain [Nesidiocoris tenuis]
MNYHVFTAYQQYPQEIRQGDEAEEQGSAYWVDDDVAGNCYGGGSSGTLSCEEASICPSAAVSCAHQGVENGQIPVFRDSYKKRTTCNKKERRRTRSINNAFADLRDRIPNVPADTKLSKIKTLRLATSYICYLMEVLENDDCGDGFKADLPSQPRRVSSTAAHLYNGKESENSRKSKGRTGWPQHVWALELKQEAL